MLAALIGVPLVLLTLYVLIFIGFFIIFSPAEDYSQRTAFDSQVWRDRSLDEQEPLWPTRLRMIDDLFEKQRLDRLTRTEVLALLGPSDQTDKWQDWHLVYWLGPERDGFVRIDSEWLVIRFDAAGQVASYRLVRD
ncbi:MAG TPA: hypothetical protein VM115_03300 [Vicinamibacterales bacterium]|nr:hypothetical protein [Vicinamibacterales bacterium]